jgi:hypothetical protein
VLRGSDLVALGTHVYGGGDNNSASVLGRYGNPIQDYIGALEVPLASPGQINMVTVGNAYVSQENAATGPQTKEIAKLGENVVVHPSGTDASNKPEFWIFEGAEEVFKLATELAGALGTPVSGLIGTTIAPIIAQGLAEANNMDVSAALQRFALANKSLLMAESKFQEEGFFDDLANAITGPLKIMPIGGPVIRLPFEEIMKGINVVGGAADKLVNDVANEIARGIVLRAQSLQMQTKAESAMEVDGKQDSASANQRAFLEELAKAAKAHKSTQQSSSGPQAEGWFDDAISGIVGVGNDIVNIGGSVVDAAVNVGNTVADAGKGVGNTVVNGVVDAANGVNEGLNIVNNHVNKVANEVAGHIINGANKLGDDVTRPFRPEGFFDDVVGFLGSSPVNGVINALPFVLGPMGAPLAVILPTAIKALQAESAFENAISEKAAAVMEDLRRLAQALILHNVLADKFLDKVMGRPVSELKAEGFFDDLFSAQLHAGAGVAAAVAGVTAVAPMVGLPLLLCGVATAGIGKMLSDVV